MPRIIRGHKNESRSHYPDLVTELAEELRTNRPYGQPVIHEQRFPKTNALRTTVIWDSWESVMDEDRVAIILQAYSEVEGEEFRERVALAIGLTVPEAHSAGLLPVQITAAVRASDPVTIDQCRVVMIELGGSVLSNPKQPVLRFATAAEAEQCVRQLVDRLPASEPVWVVAEDAARIFD